MIKSFALILVTLLVVICLTGCTTKGSYTVVMYDENSGDDFWDADYEKFDGAGNYIVRLDADNHSGSFDIKCD